MTKRQVFEFFEYAFTIAALILYSGGPLQVILTGGASEGENQVGAGEPDFALVRLLCMVTYVVFGLLVLYRWRRSLYGLYKGRVLLALTGLAVLSYFWSDFPSITLTRSIALIGTTLFGVYLGTRFTLQQLIRIISITFGIIVLLSLIFIVALPKYGVMAGVHTGAWRGIFVHKNNFGRALVFAVLGFLPLSAEKRSNRIIFWGLLGLCTFLILMSKSTSALLNLFYIVTAFNVLRVTRWRFEIRLLALIAILLVGGVSYSLITSNLESILSFFGKDATLTGRTDLWPLCVGMAERRPFFGYGYEAFWNGWNSGGGEIWMNYGWRAPHCHNGYLDLTLALGVVGSLLFLYTLFTTLILGLVRLQRTSTFENFYCVLVPFFLLLYNLTESSILGRNSLSWVIFISVYIAARVPISLPDRTPTEDSLPEPPLLARNP
ncbi:MULTISPECIES: O-antigen ligase [unclassified Leptolyngbya]|uniref:O-antigen ligase family protein n=1 Tax=unclassified Leptolyngbya TaxID=2650499 RepID=UPI001689667E|nr:MULTISPECIES: O-antigen ligase [unclassified Leptolyngbya]MBD1910725.1 O-antigen ligase family protein [Leptolyngbya sp. FACHB-8]MBD2158160.1 O-antigen ligase family protein [Leptolyngbya sp. FACHB-16]